MFLNIEEKHLFYYYNKDKNNMHFYENLYLKMFQIAH